MMSIVPPSVQKLTDNAFQALRRDGRRRHSARADSRRRFRLEAAVTRRCPPGLVSGDLIGPAQERLASPQQADIVFTGSWVRGSLTLCPRIGRARAIAWFRGSTVVESQDSWSSSRHGWFSRRPRLGYSRRLVFAPLLVKKVVRREEVHMH